MSKLDFPRRKAALFKPVRGIPEDDPVRGPSDASLLGGVFNAPMLVERGVKLRGVNAGVNAGVNIKPKGRKADRHSPAYMREYMRKKRASK